MRFDLTGLPAEAIMDDVAVGDVFPAKGGKGDTAIWIVAALRSNSAYLLGVNRDGEIVSTTSYGLHALRDRVVIGRCTDLTDLRLCVTARANL